MGLFSNNKKLCPICGSPTPRLLPTKIEDIPICKECDKKIDLPDGLTNQMSLDNFRQYIAFYEENRSLRDAFSETDRCDYGPGLVVVDSQHGLFRLKNSERALVFEASCLKSFQIWEDRNVLFEGDGTALRCYESDVPDRASAMQADIDRFTRDRQEYERMERMERMLEQRERDGENRPPRRYIPEPRFEAQGPVRQFRLEILMEHPYWKGVREAWNGPEFSTFMPSVRDYLNNYEQETEALYALACGLMTLLNPEAQELHVGQGAGAVPAAQPQSIGDAVSEIQKYKTLMDAGVITEEEFTAKKRQLLGI